MKIDLNKLATAFADVEFFLACVSPDSEIVCEGADAPGLDLWSEQGFWAVSSRVRATGQSLIHDLDGKRVVFCGYDAGLGVHSYAAPDRLALLADPAGLRNGAFAYLGFDPVRQEAVVRTDALGISPLYYRKDGGSWWFASHPSLLHVAGDEVDLVAWASLMQRGHPIADRSFYVGIERMRAGTQLTLRHGAAEQEHWFDFHALPPGERQIDDAAFAEVEQAYEHAMERCMALGSSYILPFSSGYDSRRFFATLTRRKAGFKAVTCQTFHRKQGRDYDIDSFFAPQIASAFGVQCELVQASPPERMEADNAFRQNLIGTETFMHSWAVPFMKWLAVQRPSIVFDGLAGDTFGNSGFEIDGLHESPEKDAGLVLKEVVKPEFFRHMSGLFPSYEAFAAEYRNYQAQFAPNLNNAELAFLQSRTRRAISPWITMMHPPGQVIVFPYCDMEFILATMKYHPAEKYKWFFQKECLRRFYPEYFDFPGSRNLPAGHPPLDAGTSRLRDQMEDRYVYGSVARVFGALKYLSWKNKALLLMSTVFPWMRKRRGWLFGPLLSLVRTAQEAPSFIQRNSTRKDEQAAGQGSAVNHAGTTRRKGLV